MIADASSQTPAGVAREPAKPRVMTIHEASRTLLKSPPELWAECSDAASLSRHLDQFGEIKITRLEPETAVAWEGEQVSGTVRLEPSGWGTRVILTAEEVEIPDLGRPAEPLAAQSAAVEPTPPTEQTEPTDAAVGDAARSTSRDRWLARGRTGARPSLSPPWSASPLWSRRASNPLRCRPWETPPRPRLARACSRAFSRACDPPSQSRARRHRSRARRRAPSPSRASRPVWRRPSSTIRLSVRRRPSSLIRPSSPTRPSNPSPPSSSNRASRLN